MVSGFRVFFRMAKRLVRLPRFYFTRVNWRQCRRSRAGVAADLLYIFFRLRNFPDHYSPCQLDRKPRARWAEYYGSNYGPLPKERLPRLVQPPEFQVLFNDKAVCELVCRGIGIPLPGYLGTLPAGADAAQIEALFATDGARQQLIIKSRSGSAGRGIVVVRRRGNGLVIDDGSGERPLGHLRLAEDAVVQKYITQHPDIARIAPSTVNTIRMLTLWTPSGDALVISAVMRFGVGRAHVDNWSAGGVAVGVEVTHGRLMDTAFDKLGNDFTVHPDSGFRFSGFQLPWWPQCLDVARRIQTALSFHRLIGIDVAITSEGPVVVELNARPDLVFQEQAAGPLLRDPRVLQAFHQYGLLYNPEQLRLAREAAQAAARHCGLSEPV